MTAIAVLDDYQDAATTYGDWGSLPEGTTTVVFRDHVVDADELVARLVSFDVVVAMRERTAFGRDVLERLPALRLLVTTGMGNAAIDVAAALELGITVCGTGGHPHGTAELTWALILNLARHVGAEHAAVRAGAWQQTMGTDLHGATLGVLGLGRLGSTVARIGQAFGMEVVAWSPNLTEEKAQAQGVRRVDKATLFSASDVITIHMVLSARTEGLVGASELTAMKPTALLINTSRGPLVDEAALADALHHRRIAGAGLDVFATEPLPRDHPFRELRNVVVTPHIGYVTDATYRIFYGHAVEDIAAFLAGDPVRLIKPR